MNHPALHCAPSKLPSLLGSFAGRMNDETAVRGRLAGWHPAFFIQAADSGETFEVEIDDGLVQGVHTTAIEPGYDALLVRGDAAVLERVLSGRLNPFGAYTHGLLEVHGPARDQNRLDGIALALWGA